VLFVCVHNAGRSQMAAALVTMGCGHSCPVYPGKHYEDWDVADPAGQPIEVVRTLLGTFTPAEPA